MTINTQNNYTTVIKYNNFTISKIFKDIGLINLASTFNSEK